MQQRSKFDLASSDLHLQIHEDNEPYPCSVIFSYTTLHLHLFIQVVILVALWLS